jgi:malate dehydrogenase
LIFSFPCRTEGGKLKVITGLTQNEFGKQKMEITLDELRKERDAVRELALI